MPRTENLPYAWYETPNIHFCSIKDFRLLCQVSGAKIEEAVAVPIVPKDSITGRSLTAVVAIMTFLASLTTGVAMLVVSAASDWQSEVSREVTIQVRPAPGRDNEADVRTASDIARATPGIAEIRAFTKEESARLI